MYSVSSAFNLAIHQPIRVLKSKVVVSGGSTFDDNVIQSITIKRSVIPENGFVLGGVNSTQVTICLLDPDDSISPEDFTGVELTPHIGVKLADETYEYIPMGIFIADQPTRKEGILEIIAFDRMVLLEKPFESAISYPSTPWDILQEIVTASGLVLDNTSILNGDSYIMSAVVDVTMRQMVGYIAEVAGGYAKITRDGKLKIVKFETGTALEEIKPSNYFAPMAVADTALTITGITVRPTPSIVGKTYGATDNPYVSIGNPILKRYPTDTINSLLSSLSTVNYWPFSVEWQGNPALDEGDYITVQDVKTNTVRNTIFGDETLSYSGGLRSAISLSARSAQKNATDTQTSISNQFNSMSGGMDGRPMFGINNHLMADFYGINPDFIKRTNNKVINSGFELHDATTMKPVGWSGDGVASAEEAWEGSKSLKLLSGNIMIQENGVVLEGRDRISFRHKGGVVNVRVTSGATTEEYVWSSTTTAHFPSGTVNASNSPTAVKLSDGRVLYMYVANSGIYQAYVDSVENFVSQDNTVVNPTLVEGSLLLPRVLIFNSPDGDLFHIRCYCNNADTRARVRIYKCSVGDGSDWQYYSDVYDVTGYTGNTTYVGSHPLGIHFEGSRWILVAPGLFYDSGWLMESIGISTSDNGGLAWTRRYNNDGLLAMAYLEMCSRNISINMDGNLCWTWSSSAGLGSNVYLTSTDGTSWTQIVSSEYYNHLFQSFSLISDGGKQYILRTNDSHLFSSITQPTVLPLTGDTFDDWTYVDTLPALGFAAGIQLIFQRLGNTLVAMKGGWAGVATVLGITIQSNRLHLYDNSTDEGTDEPVAWQDGDSLTYGPQDYWEYATPPALDSIREPEAYITQGFHTFFFESTAVPIYIEFECVDETDPCYIDAVQLEPDFNGKWPSIYMPGLMSVPAETHADTHKTTGSDPISPDDIGAETPTGAQGKVDLAVLPFAGGTTGQVLQKVSATDFDVEWVNAASGGAGVATGNYGWKNSWAGIPTTTTSVWISKGALVMPLADIKIMGMNLPIDETAGNTFKFGIYEVNSSYVQTAIIFESDAMTSIGKAVYVQKFTEVITFLSGHYYIVAAFTTTSGDTYIGACSSSIIYEPYEGGFKGFARLNALPSNGATWGVSVIGDTYATGLLVELIEQTTAISYQNPIDEPPEIPNALDDEFTETTLDAKWTWLNQGAATITLNGSYLRFNMFSSGDNNRMLIQAAPTTPYTIISKIRLYVPIFNWATCGITLYNSGNNRRAILGIGTSSGNTRAHLIEFNSETAYNADPWIINGYGDPSMYHYIKVEVTSTTYSLYTSCDGDEWIFIGTDTIARRIGAITHIGIGYFRNNTNGVVHSSRFDWFRVI